MAAPDIRDRMPPSGPLAPGTAVGASIRQYDIRRTLNLTEGEGPQIEIAGTQVPLEGSGANGVVRIGEPLVGNRLLCKWQVALQLLAWDNAETFSSLIEFSIDEGMNWLPSIGGALSTVAFPQLISASGTPDVDANQTVSLWHQAELAVPANPGPTVLARVTLSVTGESPAAVIIAEEGRGWVELYELTPQVPAP